MPTKIRIHITKEVLEKSMYCGCGYNENENYASNCAVAVAVSEIFPNVIVEVDQIHFKTSNYSSCSLPAKATNFILKFDCKRPDERRKMKPISFDIDVPDAVIDEISIEEITDKLKSCETVELCRDFN